MREMTVKILAGLAIPAAIIAVLLPAAGGGTAPSEKQNVPLLPGLHNHAGELATITITGADGKITLTRTPTAQKPSEGWLLRDKGFYPVPVATIRPVLDGLIGLRGVAAKTANAKFYGRLDVGNPGKDSQSHLVSLFDTKAATLGEIILGRQKEATGVGATPGTYARVPTEKQSWLAEPAITLPAETLDWVNQSIVDIDADKVKEVALNVPGNAPLDFARDKPADTLTVRGLPTGTKLKSDTPGSDVENVFQSFNMQDVEPAAQLKGNAAGTVHLVTFNGLTADFTLTKDNGQTWMTVTAAGTGAAAKEAADITARTKGWAYEVPADKVGTLTTKLADLVQPPAAKPTK